MRFRKIMTTARRNTTFALPVKWWPDPIVLAEDERKEARKRRTRIRLLIAGFAAVLVGIVCYKLLF